MKSKGILYLNRFAEIGGAELSLQTLADCLRGTDYRPVVVLGKDGPLRQRLEKMDIIVYVYPFDWCHSNKLISFMRTIAFLRRIIKKEGIKLIHSNQLWDNQYGAISAKIEKIPHILHVRLAPESKGSWKSFYRLSSMAICNSEYTYNQFVNFSGFKKRVEVIYNGIDTNIFKPDSQKRIETRTSYGFRDDDFVMGMAGRLTEEKGQLPLLKFLLSLLRENKNYKILISGDAKTNSGTIYPEQIVAFINENDLDRKIILTGFLEDMTGFYNAIDLFLLPSTWEEPFGRVLIEAMATEKPVIASRVGGVPEVVDHGMTGYLVNPDDVDGWCKCIDKLVNDGRVRNQFGETGRKKVLEKFTLEHMTSQIVSIYSEMINSS